MAWSDMADANGNEPSNDKDAAQGKTADSQATLVVGPSWVGDMVMAQSLFKVLKERGPNAAIDVLAPAWSSPLLTRMPEVRAAVPMPLGHGQLRLKTRFRIGRNLEGIYDRAIVLPNSFKSALIPFHARIPRRTGFIGELRWGVLTDARRLDKKALGQTVERFVALGLEKDAPLPDPIPSPSLSSSPKRAKKILKKFGLNKDKRPMIILTPGAEYGPAKQWPQQHFAAVASAQGKLGHNVLLLGTEKEHDLCAAIADKAGDRGFNLAGKTTLEDAVDILSSAHGVVCNDSGLMHVAAALGRPVVAIFGSSDPEHTPPVGPRVKIISLGLPCAPCFKRVCPEQHTHCLEEISPDVVIKQLAGMVQT